MMEEERATNWRLWQLKQTLKGMEASPKRRHLFLAIQGLKKKIARMEEQDKIKAVHGK